MKLNKTSSQADKIANLYRAALSLAKGDQQTAKVFINKSKFKSKRLNLKTRQDELILAEKLLDQYNKLRFAKS